MHNNIRFSWLTMIALTIGCVWSTRASAQDPDVRSLTPVVMLVLDTSGSMEGKPGCSCPSNPASNLCEECYPNCAAGEKNRWALAVEALSGSFDSFQCQRIDRSDSAFTYDRNYVAPHHALPPPITPCTLLGSECQTGLLGLLGLGLCLPLLGQCDGGSEQNDDGVLDAYRNDVRFGLLTFDTVPTYGGSSSGLIPDYEFNEARSESAEGAFSFGGPQDFTYPNCTSTYRMDTGVRSEIATEGRLISAGNDSSNWAAINDQIQASLLSIRPFGGTPIAASLADLDYYFRNHPDMTSDAYSACRGRYGVLITDGKPDDDFRQFGCDQPGFQCPYPLPEDQAGILRCGPTDPDCSGGGSGSIERLYVIGLDVTDPAARMSLNNIAERGGNVPDPITGDSALFASDAATITTALAGILDTTQRFPISRTTPLVVRSKTGNGIPYRITAAFDRLGGGQPWIGLLERQQLGCGTNPDVPLTPEGEFHERLNTNNDRKLFTALPSSPGFDANMAFGEFGGCGGTACPNTCFDSTSAAGAGMCSNDVTIAETGSADAAALQVLTNWMHARPGSTRQNNRLGALYHSSPAFAGAPRFDTADESFNAFRFLSNVRDREEVVYVGSNDGILHAFRLETNQFDASKQAGDELWGFIPPLLLDKLQAAMTAPQIMLDGSPVVKNVFFSRSLGSPADGSDYHTVVVSGMRQGGRGYFALDVTNPEEPHFLWQFVHPRMGFTYARPALTQISANFSTAVGGPSEVTQRGIAILAGGTGTELVGPCNSARDTGGAPFATYADSSLTPAAGPTHRTRVRCWATVGRSIHFVDIQTGARLNTTRLDMTNKFPSPLVGTPAVFNGQDGALATRAFIADADGVLWRIDMSDPDPAQWDAAPFHDMAWGLDFDQGQPGFEPPLVSVDNQGRVVVLFAQGNLDNFENPTAINRVVSLTEIDTDPTNPSVESVKAGFNWEYNLPPSALVTGPMALLEGIVMFASFQPVTSGTQTCDPGQSWLHAFDYIQSDGVNTGTPPTPAPFQIDGLGPEFNQTTPPTTLYGKLLMGLSVAQRVACETAVTTTAVTPQGWTASRDMAAGPPTFEVVSNSASATPAAGSNIGSERRFITLVPRSRVVSWAGASD